MAKKDVPVEVVETEAEVVDVEVVETPEVEETEVVETETVEEVETETEEVEVEEKTPAKYPKSPKGEGVDPLTAGPALPNTEPNNQA